MTSGDWVTFKNIYNAHGLLAEAAVAGFGAMLDPAKAEWEGGPSSVDVRWPDHAVDAKRGFIEMRRYLKGPKQVCIGFMGASRETQAREGVTYYAIAVAKNSPSVRITASNDSFEVQLSNARYELYLFPAKLINEQFHPEIRRDGSAGKGLNRWLPLESAATFRVRPPDHTAC